MYYHTFSPVEYSVRRTKSNDINEPLVEGTATKKSLKDSYVDAKESPLLCFSKQQFIRRFCLIFREKVLLGNNSFARLFRTQLIQGNLYFAHSLFGVSFVHRLYSVYILHIAISPQGYHSPINQCFGTDMVYWIYLSLKCTVYI